VNVAGDGESLLIEVDGKDGCEGGVAMIRFSCMYCGRRIRANGRSAGKKAHCPTCGHELLIPHPAGAPGEVSTAGDAPACQDKAVPWEGMTNKEIARLLLRNKPLTEEDRARAVAQAAASPLLPRYDELTLFVLSAAFLMLVGISPEVKADLGSAMGFTHDGRIMVVLSVATIGMVLSLFGIFFKGPKPDLFKWPMLVFAVLVTAGAGVYAGYVTLENAQGWLIIFPAWNIINGVLLLAMLRAGLMDTHCIIDGAARFSQVVMALICAGVVLGVC
jgi:DNA-directed RNA polymerase subunit RPC12/RpoP